MAKQWDAMWTNATIATGEKQDEMMANACLAVKGNNIAWVGEMQALSARPHELAETVYDVKHRCITPGLIDCHTHLIFAGNRANEFEKRLKGATYEEIARQGGGIQSTVAATRTASQEELYYLSKKRVLALMQSGVTTLEIKSGYGLDLETEEKILYVAKKLEETLPITVSKTFLGAHTLPLEYRGRSDAYIDHVCQDMIPHIAEKKLADAVDVFCEKIAFNLAQTERVFITAKQHGLQVKCHAEQLSDSGSAALAAKYHALSVDHLEHLSLQGVEAMVQSGTIAVLLPGAFYFLRETKLPPIQLLREQGVPIALASDCNPGTSPIMSLLLIMNMACTLFRLTPQEVLLGVTQYAAKSLGMEQTIGTLSANKQADFIVWDVASPVELMYYMGVKSLHQFVKLGRVIDLANL